MRVRNDQPSFSLFRALLIKLLKFAQLIDFVIKNCKNLFLREDIWRALGSLMARVGWP
jgi:hypothetical protein